MEFLKDLLSQPAVIAGLVVLVGLIALKKPATQVITGTVKAMLGMVILSAGATLICNALANFSSLFESAFHMTGIVPSNEAGMGITLGKFGTIATFVFVFGLVLDIVLARFTKFKYIFLSSDHALYMACAITPFLMVAGLDTVPAIICGSLILGTIPRHLPGHGSRAHEEDYGRQLLVRALRHHRLLVQRQARQAHRQGLRVHRGDQLPQGTQLPVRLQRLRVPRDGHHVLPGHGLCPGRRRRQARGRPEPLGLGLLPGA